MAEEEDGSLGSSPAVRATPGVAVVVVGRKVADAVEEGREERELGEEQGEGEATIDVAGSRGAREEEEEKNAAEGSSDEEKEAFGGGGG